MKNDNKTTKTGLGFVEALTLLFIALKLCKVIDWEWVWVLSPVWIMLSIIVVVLAVYGCLLLADKWEERKTVPCTNCKYRGTTVSYGVGNIKIYCLKHKMENPITHRCKEGVKEKHD